MDLATARQLFTEHGPDKVKVVYDPGDGCPAEEGVITAVTELFVFVRYGTDFGSKATRAAALRLAPPTCPDGGTCHHLCARVEQCFRVGCCGPLSGVYPENRWPADVLAAHQRATVLVAESGAEYVLGDPIGLAPEPGSVCDAAQWGDIPTQAVIDGLTVCRCTVCPRCHHHTGNAHQGHYWAHCRITGTTREPHMCCPDPEFGCEIEQRFAVDMGFMSLPPLRYGVACPACGSRDEYTRPDPPEHTCGHKVGGLEIPTPECGKPRDPDEDGEMWWCRPCRQYHVPKRDPELLRAAQLMLEDAEQRFDEQGRPVIDDD